MHQLLTSGDPKKLEVVLVLARLLHSAPVNVIWTVPPTVAPVLIHALGSSEQSVHLLQALVTLCQESEAWRALCLKEQTLSRAFTRSIAQGHIDEKLAALRLVLVLSRFTFDSGAFQADLPSVIIGSICDETTVANSQASLHDVQLCGFQALANLCSGCTAAKKAVVAAGPALLTYADVPHSEKRRAICGMFSNAAHGIGPAFSDLKAALWRILQSDAVTPAVPSARWLAVVNDESFSAAAQAAALLRNLTDCWAPTPTSGMSSYIWALANRIREAALSGGGEGVMYIENAVASLANIALATPSLCTEPVVLEAVVMAYGSAETTCHIRGLVAEFIVNLVRGTGDSSAHGADMVKRLAGIPKLRETFLPILQSDVQQLRVTHPRVASIMRIAIEVLG
eukprot:TRINITY_DN5516_c0_g1_i2.p1 TRINITY_DN5516_c0_g1~~TRINITY_DN5516_c0_g1_i2.p1  ORF type:complete len:397 (-),score=36.08 TRINITY_DN5516_c0_g1_i2:64-1254(-)